MQAYGSTAPPFRLPANIGRTTSVTAGVIRTRSIRVPGEREAGDWLPYVGAGPTFGLSHRGFSTDETDHVDTGSNDTPNRFDFSDTDFNGGVNFIVGMRKTRGAFFEMRATAWGVSNIRLLAGFNF